MRESWWDEGAFTWSIGQSPRNHSWFPNHFLPLLTIFLTSQTVQGYGYLGEVIYEKSRDTSKLPSPIWQNWWMAKSSQMFRQDVDTYHKWTSLQPFVRNEPSIGSKTTPNPSNLRDAVANSFLWRFNSFDVTNETAKSDHCEIRRSDLRFVKKLARPNFWAKKFTH